MTLVVDDEVATVSRPRLIVFLVAVAVAGMVGVGGWALLWSSKEGNSTSNETTQTTQPLPPARSVAKDLPSELIPGYRAGAAECPRVPWTFMPPWASSPAITAAT